MFDKIRQLKKARDIQNSLKEKEITVEENGFLVVIDGSLKVKEIKINASLNKEDQEIALKNCLNKAMQEAQMMAVKEISQMGGLGI